MEAHAHFLERLRGRVSHLHVLPGESKSLNLLAGIGAAAGVVGGVVLALPLVLYDWAKAGHSALELPMAVTAWLFGLEHFARNGYHWWPIVIGALVLLAYWGILGAAFAGLADRVYQVRTRAGSLALGAVWSFASFMLFWYMLLPIARDGAPFRMTAAAPDLFVAPNWVWILGFAISGLATGIAYRALAVRGATRATAAPSASKQAA